MTIRRLAQALALCGVAALGIFSIIASSSTTPSDQETTPRPSDQDTGVEEISLFRSNNPKDDQFVYVNPLLIFMPRGAIVSGVTNISTDVNGNGVKLELVRHTDANGVLRGLGPANCPTAPLEPQTSTPIFNGLTVEGEWRVRAVCISQVFLNNPPARIALQIEWTK